MRDLNNNIKDLLFREYNIFSAFKLSGYLTLVDKKGSPVVFVVDGKKHIFTFNKKHMDINIGKNKKDFSFYEKLYIANLFNPELRWKNLIFWQLKKALKSYTMIEPRQFCVKVTNGDVSFLINK